MLIAFSLPSAFSFFSGGQSSMAWACVASLLKVRFPILAMDLRGHGGTKTSEEHDLVRGDIHNHGMRVEI